MQNKTIKGIHLYNLRNAMYLGFIQLILNSVNENNVVAPKLKRELDELTAGMSAMSPLFQIRRGSSFTKAVESADFRRDEAIKGINMQISSYMHHYTEEKRQAAKQLKRIMKNWGKKVAEKNYFEESGIIRAMVYQLTNNPTYIQAVATLNLSDWVAELQNANKEFNEIYGERISDIGKKTKERMKSKRVEVNKLYYNLREGLMAHAFINNFEEPYSKLIAIWNVIIQQVKQSTRKKGKDKEEGEEEESKT